MLHGAGLRALGLAGAYANAAEYLAPPFYTHFIGRPSVQSLNNYVKNPKKKMAGQFLQYQRAYRRAGYGIMGGVSSDYGPKPKKRGAGKVRNFRSGYDRTGGVWGRFQSPLELKFHDYNDSLILDSTGGALGTSWNLIEQGTAENQRVGRKMTIKSIAIKLSLQTLADVNLGFVHYTIVIVLDTQCNGAEATWNEIMENSSSHNTYRNLANSERFQILKTWRGTLNANAVQGSGPYGIPQAKDLKFYKKCNITIEFDSTAGLIGEVKSNNIQMFAIEPTAAPQLIAQWHSRIRFTDGK